jgi:hypothetical protein
MRSTAHAQAVDIQKVLYQDIMDPSTDKGERARLALAWERLEERKRILKMKPLPKSIDVSKLPKRGRRSQASNEPIEPDMLPGAK